ncbi:methionine adenosyltransferase [Paenibacillus chitinolyticus]|uniref:methionine adenosyltransferase n=1 Tax=Paenibacillus chitinolyticus TaxID=79263 RepID=UPI0036DE8F85
MNILVTSGQMQSVGKNQVEFVERKGEGHPDSLSDIIADLFVNNYIKHCWDKFPLLKSNFKFPNHYADKINLAGAVSVSKFGSYDIVQPMEALLIGKVTRAIGHEQINVLSIFQNSVIQGLTEILEQQDIANNVTYHVKNNDLGGADHGNGFYNPRSEEELLNLLEHETLANDTTVVTSFAPFSVTESLTIYIERTVNSKQFKKQFKAIGTDVKVLIVRIDKRFDITVCLPFHPEYTPDFNTYSKTLLLVKSYLEELIYKFLDNQLQSKDYCVDLNINTKDKGEKVYLAPWGTALSKGDCGVVGRGNKYNGIISVSRPSSVEAPAGKNANHFAGKLYSSVSHSIAHYVFEELGLENQTTISSKNGGVLSEPAYVVVECVNKVDAVQEREIKRIVERELNKLNEYRIALIYTDPIERFRNGKLDFKQSLLLDSR